MVMHLRATPLALCFTRFEELSIEYTVERASRYSYVMNLASTRVSRRVARLLAALFMILGAATASAAPLGSVVDMETASALLRGEEPRASSAAGGLSLLPLHQAAYAIRDAIRSEPSDVVVEAAFLWLRPGPSAPDEILRAYNALRSIGRLEGIEYYSASRGRMRTLYERSTLMAGPDSDVALPDARLPSLPAGGETLYALQRDTTFGENRYRVELSSGDGYVRQSSSNLTEMRLGFIPVAGPGDVVVRVLVLQVDEGLLFYVASSAKAPVVPGVRGSLERSFANRAAAAFAWFSGAMDDAARDGR